MSRRAWQLLDDKKAQDIILLDVRGICTITDYFLIATGANAPHLKALAEAVEIGLKQQGVGCIHQSGTAESGWMVVDYFDVVLHLFTAEKRAYYALERLWADGKVVAAAEP